jgi:hypothetical protein
LAAERGRLFPEHHLGCLDEHGDVVALFEREPLHGVSRDRGDELLFRDLAGASFVVGAATRILELASLPPARDTPMQAAAAT